MSCHNKFREIHVAENTSGTKCIQRVNEILELGEMSLLYHSAQLEQVIRAMFFGEVVCPIIEYIINGIY